MDSSQEENRLDRNQLHRSLNPYLTQHAHNPVWWQEWSQTILDIAQGLKRPLFISIGYSTCHWCHVMEEESFSDPTVAEIINRYFISIKIDREERPDLDTYYMNTAHFMGIAGGWPLNIFADSRGVPFWICTYAPPQARQGMAAFKDIVFSLGENWEKSQEKIISQTEKNSAFMKGFFAGEITDQVSPNDDELKDDFFMKQQEFIDNHKQFFDDRYGGFKFQTRVKFPHLMGLEHLLELGIYNLHRGKPSQTLEMVIKSIMHLIRGGIYDHLGGGLFRYSTDYEWKIPHFEKMLYDNALLIELLTHACRSLSELKELKENKSGSHPPINENWEEVLSQFYQRSKTINQGNEKKKTINDPSNPLSQYLVELKLVLEKTLGYWNREMSLSIEGSRMFFAAQDAGGKGQEGDYYIWRISEINDLLTPQEQSNFHSHYALHPFSRDQGTFILIKKNQISNSQSIHVIEKKLFEYRNLREAPARDRKILLSWNAMMACSYFNIYQAFGNEECRDRALEVVRFIDKKMVYDGNLLHSLVVSLGDEGYHVSPPSAKSLKGFLGDYAHLVRALIFSYRITGDASFLHRSQEHCQTILRLFYQDGVFSEVNPQHHDNPVSTLIEAHDGVEPSSQSLLAEVFLLLDLFYPSEKYYQYAQGIFRQFYESLGSMGLPYMTQAFHHYQNDLSMISLFGNDAVFHSLRKILGSRYLPSRLFLNPKLSPVNDHGGGKTHAVICHRHRCSKPLYNSDEIIDYFLRNSDERFK